MLCSELPGLRQLNFRRRRSTMRRKYSALAPDAEIDCQRRIRTGESEILQPFFASVFPFPPFYNSCQNHAVFTVPVNAAFICTATPFGPPDGNTTPRKSKTTNPAAGNVMDDKLPETTGGVVHAAFKIPVAVIPPEIFAFMFTGVPLVHVVPVVLVIAISKSHAG